MYNEHCREPKTAQPKVQLYIFTKTIARLVILCIYARVPDVSPEVRLPGYAVQPPAGGGQPHPVLGSQVADQQPQHRHRQLHQVAQQLSSPTDITIINYISLSYRDIRVYRIKVGGITKPRNIINLFRCLKKIEEIRQRQAN